MRVQKIIIALATIFLFGSMSVVSSALQTSDVLAQDTVQSGKTLETRNSIKKDSVETRNGTATRDAETRTSIDRTLSTVQKTFVAASKAESAADYNNEKEKVMKALVELESALKEAESSRSAQPKDVAAGLKKIKALRAQLETEVQTKGFDNPLAGFDNPLAGFDNPLAGLDR